MSTVNIPRLDLNLYIQGNTSQRAKFSDDIGKAFNETGFVTVTNHGLNKELIDKLYADVKALFALPDPVKSKYEIPGMAGQRGYTGKRKRKQPRGFKTPDLKRVFLAEWKQTVTDDDAVKNMNYPDNLVVDVRLPGFNSTNTRGL